MTKAELIAALAEYPLDAEVRAIEWGGPESLRIVQVEGPYTAISMDEETGDHAPYALIVSEHGV